MRPLSLSVLVEEEVFKTRKRGNINNKFDFQVEDEPVLKMKLPDGQSVTGLRHSVNNQPGDNNLQLS